MLLLLAFFLDRSCGVLQVFLAGRWNFFFFDLKRAVQTELGPPAASRRAGERLKENGPGEFVVIVALFEVVQVVRLRLDARIHFRLGVHHDFFRGERLDEAQTVIYIQYIGRKLLILIKRIFFLKMICD